jgi:hypothetical protein
MSLREGATANASESACKVRAGSGFLGEVLRAVGAWCLGWRAAGP